MLRPLRFNQWVRGAQVVKSSWWLPGFAWALTMSQPAAAPALPTPTVVLHEWPDMPLWAYGVTAAPRAGDQAKPQGPPGRKFDPAFDHDQQLQPLHVVGSTRVYSLVDLSDWQNVVDWFPNEHAPMPAVVQHGPASLGTQTRACAFCHKTTGGGRTENAPVAYFMRQLEDFRSGRRSSSDPRKPNVPTMTALAQAMSDDEERAAAQYYAAQGGGPPLQVIESDRAPPAHLHGNLYVAAGSERTEPLHGRILEVAQDSEQSETLDNPHFGYIAYVPTGSIARGQALARGTGATPACSSCHGEGLRGLGETPPIAGLSPSYLVRQLYDLKTGARNGVQALSMKPVVARLTATQMTDIAAYIATLPRAEAARH
jgi:cytochrome c553